MTLSRQLLRSLLTLDCGAAVAADTCLHIADTVGITLAATRQPGLLQALLEAVAADQGRCHVLGLDRKLPPSQAAFVNAALAHALDFDDIHDAARLHPTPVSLAAALAAAEYVGADAAQLVHATALGNELMCRLGLACAPTGSGPGSEWFLTQLFGYLGAALSAGLLLGLDEAGLVSALGLAYMQAAGGKEAGVGTGSNARAVYPAFAAQGGLQAALMARAGFVGPATALDGKTGLLPLYLGLQLGSSQQELLMDTRRWRALGIDFKPWPCCRLSHPYVAAALALRMQLQGREPQRLRVKVNDSARRLCEPLAGRCQPQTLQDAKYSIPFMTAFALRHGRVSLDLLDDSALRDESVLALASRVEIDPCLPDAPGHPPASVQLQLPSGAWLESGADPALLAPSTAQVQGKFLDCAARAGHARPRQLLQHWLDAHRVRQDVGALMLSTRLDLQELP